MDDANNHPLYMVNPGVLVRISGTPEEDHPMTAERVKFRQTHLVTYMDVNVSMDFGHCCGNDGEVFLF
jgi:hypothetical protein